MKYTGALAAIFVLVGWSVALGQSVPTSQMALQWAAAGQGSFGLELGIAGPSSIALKPRAASQLNGETTSFNSDEKFEVEVRNAGTSTVLLCGDQPTFTITAVDGNGRNLDVLGGLGPGGNSLGPRQYSQSIAPGALWSPGAKVPLAVIDADASAGTYTLRARMVASICDGNQKHFREITIYSGPITASFLGSSK